MRKSNSLRKTAALLLLLALTCLFSVCAYAEDGWHVKGNKIWYTTTDAEGNSVRLKYFQQINGYTYYFNGKGYLRTGWLKRGGKYYYLRTTGKLGKRGRMYVNRVSKIKKTGTYGFGPDGNVLTGLQNIGGSWYFFSESTVKGVRGRMLKSVFTDTSDGRRIYLLKTGKMAVNRWVKVKKKRYYLGADGNLLKNTVTPDGWVVNAYGVRTKKAAASDDSSDSTVTKLRAAGTRASTGKASILILCGHGQGDPGAGGSAGGIGYSEAVYTRDFGTRIYNQLKDSGKVNVDLFNTNLDTFQQFRSTLNSVIVSGKTLQSRINGSGTYAVKTYNAIRSNKNILDPLNYDYVLEVHFDASVSKDASGDGKVKGTFMYVNKRKSNVTLDKNIIVALNKLGLPTLGSRVWYSPGAGETVGLLNARTYQEMGVSYGLLETCFIDDKDDMKFYFAHRDDMAKSISDTIVSYFS